MDKEDLVNAVAAQTGISKALAAETLDALIGTITATITKGGTVQLIGGSMLSNQIEPAGRSR